MIVRKSKSYADQYERLLIAKYNLDIPWDSTLPPIERIVGYYRSIDDTVNSTGPIRKFDIDIAVADQNDPIEDLIPAISTVGTHETIIELHKTIH